MSDVKKDDCIILNKCIYGLVQAAQQLKSSGFVIGSINPCRYVKKSTKGILYVALYVGNILMIGDITAIDHVIEALKNKELVLKIMDGCRIIYPAKLNSLMIRSMLG